MAVPGRMAGKSHKEVRSSSPETGIFPVILLYHRLTIHAESKFKVFELIDLYGTINKIVSCKKSQIETLNLHLYFGLFITFGLCSIS